MNFKLRLRIALMILMAISVSAWADDYGDTPETAAAISPNGAANLGMITDENDTDWFWFTPTSLGLYRIEINKAPTGYTDSKSIKVYQKDEFDVLKQVINWSSNNTGEYIGRDIFVEADRKIYIEVYSGADESNYYLKAHDLGSYSVDSYGDNLATATPIANDTMMTGLITRVNGELDVDWFEVNLTAGHIYRFDIKALCDNAGIAMKLYHTDGNKAGAYYNDTNGTTYCSPVDITLMVKVSGNANKVGEVYQFTCVDLGEVSDDHSDLSSDATMVTEEDGTINCVGAVDFDADYGGESYGGDNDWFKFSPVANQLYLVTGTMEEGTSRKDIKVFQIDDFGTLSQYSVTVSGDGEEAGIFIENDNDVYVKVYGGTSDGYDFEFIASGDYSDDYSDDMETATDVAIGAEHVGSINRGNPLDTDWITFETQALHKYQIALTYRSKSSDVAIRLYANDVAVSSNVQVYNFVAWENEEYKILISGRGDNFSECYRFEIIDLGPVADDDYVNGPNGANILPTDTTLVAGGIDYVAGYNSDVDFFKFDAAADGDYTFAITAGAPKGYKYLRVYRMNDLDNLIQVDYTSTYYENDPKSKTLALTQGRYYVKVESAYIANYEISIDSPTPRCGDANHPYPQGDVNTDCVVDLLDFAIMAGNWMVDNNPVNDPA
ncbi:MAG: hypothetical protein JEZ07_19925 [Phycisphaerae bacterium]|nr:hypothetical protein [Phycisphaerae bacterium]